MNNELYHYGIPGMRWGHRRGKQDYKTASKTKSKSKNISKSKSETVKAKPKMSTGKKVAIGTAAAGVALAGIGAMLSSKVVQNNHLAILTGRALAESM